GRRARAVFASFHPSRGPGRRAGRASVLRSQWPPPSPAAALQAPEPPEGRGPEGTGRSELEGRREPAHLLDGRLAAAPQPHEQNPGLGAVSAPRAAASAGPRPNAAARRRRLLFLLLHAVAEVLWKRIGRAVTARKRRLLRPVLQGHGAGPPPPAP
uniref:Uncharacterized protein n=1 Tax=Cavia porcellus TaxID=10141 RepID=A0A286X7A8_CAVPO